VQSGDHLLATESEFVRVHNVREDLKSERAAQLDSFKSSEAGSTYPTIVQNLLRSAQIGLAQGC
jgi:hypothetical protein